MILTAATPASEYSGLSASDIPAEMRTEPVRPVTIRPNTNAAGGSTFRPASDQVSLSPEGRQRSRSQPGNESDGAAKRSPDSEREPASGSNRELSPEEQQAIQELKQRDREVRAHEMAHLANAGQYAAGGPSYTYQTGPDGRRYAIGGEVPIDVSKEKTPEETIRKMQTVRRAALAPANPSGADRAIAARAAMRQAEAVRELNREKEDQGLEKTGQEPGTASGPVPPVPPTSGQNSSASSFSPLYA